MKIPLQVRITQLCVTLSSLQFYYTAHRRYLKMFLRSTRDTFSRCIVFGTSKLKTPNMQLSKWIKSSGFKFSSVMLWGTFFLCCSSWIREIFIGLQHYLFFLSSYLTKLLPLRLCCTGRRGWWVWPPTRLSSLMWKATIPPTASPWRWRRSL